MTPGEVPTWVRFAVANRLALWSLSCGDRARYRTGRVLLSAADTVFPWQATLTCAVVALQGEPDRRETGWFIEIDGRPVFDPDSVTGRPAAMVLAARLLTLLASSTDTDSPDVRAFGDFVAAHELWESAPRNVRWWATRMLWDWALSARAGMSGSSGCALRTGRPEAHPAVAAWFDDDDEE